MKNLALGFLLALSVAAIATPGADLDAILSDHEERITALETDTTTTTVSTTTPPTIVTTTTLPPSTTTTVPPATTTTTIPQGDDRVFVVDGVGLDLGGMSDLSVTWEPGDTVPWINLNGASNIRLLGSGNQLLVDGVGDSGSLQSGTVNVRDAQDIYIINVKVVNSPRSCFSMEGSSRVTLENTECWNPAHLGYHGGDTADVLIVGGLVVGSTQRCANGCEGSRSIGWESGGLKMVRSTNLVVLNNVFRDGFGPGIWFDIDVNGGEIEGNLVVNQTGEGIYVEISRNVRVASNHVINSPTGKTAPRMGWLYGGGILVSTSYGVTVESNVVDGSYHGITVIDQCWRGDLPPGYDASLYVIVGNTVSNVNKVGAAQDCSSPAVFHGTWNSNIFEAVAEFVWDTSVTPSPF